MNRAKINPIRITETNRITKPQKNLSPNERILFGKKFWKEKDYYPK